MLTSGTRWRKRSAWCATSRQAIDDGLVADTAERIADIRATRTDAKGLRSFLDKRKPVGGGLRGHAAPEPTITRQ